MPRSSRRSVSLPIILSVVSVGLSIALLVGWTLVIVKNIELTKEISGNAFLMASGIVSFAVIMTVVILLTVFVVREIREVRRRDSFIDSVTHELKSPLASIQLALETTARPDLDDERRAALREMMLDDIQRLTSLIDGILGANRVEHGDLATTVDRINLAEVVRESVRLLSRRHKLDVDAVVVDIDDSLELVTDETVFRTVLDNLVDNAIKYSGAPTKIEIRARETEGRQLVLEVEDHGIGIARHDLKRIFERFYRAPEEAVRERHGTGLGLFLVQALVRQLGGRVEALSPGEGKGTTMRIALPLRPRGA
jgi:signal transduction histidine kinase